MGQADLERAADQRRNRRRWAQVNFGIIPKEAPSMRELLFAQPLVIGHEAYKRLREKPTP